MTQPVSLAHSRDYSDQQQSCRMSMAQTVCSNDGSMARWIPASFCDQAPAEAAAVYQTLTREEQSDYYSCTHRVECMLAGGEGAACGEPTQVELTGEPGTHCWNDSECKYRHCNKQKNTCEQRKGGINF